jgi:hypothetical protein
MGYKIMINCVVNWKVIKSLINTYGFCTGFIWVDKEGHCEHIDCKLDALRLCSV